MALILNIETSTNVCSAAISNNGKVVDLKESFDDRTHASRLTVFIDQLFKDNKLKYESLDAVSVSEGPGSYTGLRIGVSVAKGICYAQNKPLIAVNTLQTMALMALESEISFPQNAILCPMIDARRMEVYSAMFDFEANSKRETLAEIIEPDIFNNYLNSGQMYFFGNGADKCKDSLTHENANFIENIYPSAKYMGTISQQLFNDKQFKDVAYFEPFYLKDFVATTPKKKMF